MEYRREIDGLRAVAVIPVIFFHAGLAHFDGGFVGVDIFFVISGYLITSLILTERKAGTFSLADFYERRARRILPALSVVTLSCLPFAWLWLLPTDTRYFSESLLSVLAFCSNIFFYLTGGYFGARAETNLVLHTWSLAVEEQFYLLFPVTLLILWKFLSARLIAIVLTMLSIVSLGSAEYLSHGNPNFSFFLLPTRGWEILTGALLAFYLQGSLAAQQHIRRFSGSLSGAGLLLVLYAICAFDESIRWPSLYTAIPVAGTALIILFGTRETFIGRVLSSKPLVGIGLLSYSAYLWHQPLFALERLRILAQPSLHVMLLLSFLSLGLAYVTWRYVEQPFRRKAVVSRARAFSILGGCIALSATAGLIGVRANGLQGRFGADEIRFREIGETIMDDRFAAIREDICHFNNRTDIGVVNFVGQWNCRVDQDFPNLIRIPVIVAGDSHAADKVVALKSNGLVPLQIGGAGCSIVPRYMTPTCRLIFSKLYEEVRDDQYYEYIVLSNSFSESELSIEAVMEAIQYWRRFNKRIVWFTGMPNYPHLFPRLMRGLPPRVDLQVSARSSSYTILKYLRTSGVHVIDTANLFCSINHCGYADERGCLILADDNHLSVWGARAFGHALLSDVIFKSYIPTADRDDAMAYATSDFYRKLGKCYNSQLGG